MRNPIAASIRARSASRRGESAGTAGMEPPVGVSVGVPGIGVGVWIDDVVSKEMSSTAKSFPVRVGVLSKSSSETVVLAPEFHIALTGVHIPTPEAEAVTRSTPLARKVSCAASGPTDVEDQFRIQASKK